MQIVLGIIFILYFIVGPMIPLPFLAGLVWVAVVSAMFYVFQVKSKEYAATKSKAARYFLHIAGWFLTLDFFATWVLFGVGSDNYPAGWIVYLGGVIVALACMIFASAFLAIFSVNKKPPVKKETILDRVNRNQRIMRGAGRTNADDLAEQLRDMK